MATTVAVAQAVSVSPIKSAESVKSSASKAPAKKRAKKPAAAPAEHPKYIDMVKEAVSHLKERNGSSRQAMLKYIMQNYRVGNDEKKVNAHLKVALKAGVKKGLLKQAKGTGATGSFKIGAKPPVIKKAKKPKVATKKASKPKAAGVRAKKNKKTATKPKSKKLVKKASSTKAKKNKPKQKVVKKTKSKVSKPTTKKSATKSKSKASKK